MRKHTGKILLSLGIVVVVAVVMLFTLNRSVEPPLDPEIIVYITRTGEKYHSESCHHLRQSKIAISLAEAKQKGKSACKVCEPDKDVR